MRQDLLARFRLSCESLGLNVSAAQSNDGNHALQHRDESRPMGLTSGDPTQHGTILARLAGLAIAELTDPIVCIDHTGLPIQCADCASPLIRLTPRSPTRRLRSARRSSSPTIHLRTGCSVLPLIPGPLDGAGGPDGGQACDRCAAGKPISQPGSSSPSTLHPEHPLWPLPSGRRRTGDIASVLDMVLNTWPRRAPLRLLRPRLYSSTGRWPGCNRC